MPSAAWSVARMTQAPKLGSRKATPLAGRAEVGDVAVTLPVTGTYEALIAAQSVSTFAARASDGCTVDASAMARASTSTSHGRDRATVFLPAASIGREDYGPRRRAWPCRQKKTQRPCGRCLR